MGYLGALERLDARGERPDPQRERSLRGKTAASAALSVRPAQRVTAAERAPPHHLGDVVRG